MVVLLPIKYHSLCDYFYPWLGNCEPETLKHSTGSKSKKKIHKNSQLIGIYKLSGIQIHAKQWETVISRKYVKKMCFHNYEVRKLHFSYAMSVKLF